MTLGGCEGSRDRAKISVEIYGVHFEADIKVLFAVVAQLVEHVIGNDEVSGSIPDNGSRN